MSFEHPLGTAVRESRCKWTALTHIPLDHRVTVVVLSAAITTACLFMTRTSHVTFVSHRPSHQYLTHVSASTEFSGHFSTLDLTPRVSELPYGHLMSYWKKWSFGGKSPCDAYTETDRKRFTHPQPNRTPRHLRRGGARPARNVPIAPELTVPAQMVKYAHQFHTCPTTTRADLANARFLNHV